MLKRLIQEFFESGYIVQLRTRPFISFAFFSSLPSF